jgi:hypothetical protein
MQSRADTRTWQQAYADAQRHVRQQDWQSAVVDAQIARQLGPRPGRRVHFHGSVFQEFNPDYYLGVAFFHLQRYAEAEASFERVAQAQLIRPGDKAYGEFERYREQLRRLRAPVANAPANSGNPAKQPPQTQPPATQPPTTQPGPVDLPAFPWPPPRFSAQSAIANDWVARGPNATLSSVARRLELAFDAAGYAERSYYRIPGGFALVSRIEQIRPDATPVQSPARWAVGTRTPGAGFLDYIRTLFNAPPGYYRVIAFIVTDQEFAASRQPATPDEARQWATGGYLRLPEPLGVRPYGEGHYTTALIYEFERRADAPEAQLRIPSDAPGRVHLEKSGLWSALSPR